MPVELLMPALSPTMTEGAVARWLKSQGDAVSQGEVIAEIETDKATLEFEAAQEGVLGKILVPAGQAGVKVNQPIAILLGPGETLDQGYEPAALSSSAALPAQTTKPAQMQKAEVATASIAGRKMASPIARRMAQAAGIDIALLQGSGPRGRIVKIDVEAAIAKQSISKAPGERAAALEDGDGFEAIPNSSMRKVIARRLAEAKATIPHFYLTVDCDIGQLVKLRESLNASSEGIKLSVNDFILRAVALAMLRVPAVNASWAEDAILRYRNIDVCVAVATPSGLMTPILRNADKKGVTVISSEVKNLANKAREGKLLPQEYQGGGITVSNLGMYGVKQFAAIINPPQGCILAVGAAEKRPVVHGDALGIAWMMTCTLSVDHRVIDGAVGAEFLSAFKKLVESPYGLLI